MIGLLTFHWADDYGAMLQAYGLKQYLFGLGEEVELLPYAPCKLTARYGWAPLWVWREGGQLRYRLHRSWWKRNVLLGGAFWARKRAMRRFRRQYLTRHRPVRRAEQLSLRGYRCVVVGSDQVWNPQITIDLDAAYTGQLPGREGCRLVAYAASLGNGNLEEPEWATLARRVRENFAAVSVRERQVAPLLQARCGREIADVVDPTLLLTRSQWENIALPPPEKGYILLYHTERSEPLMQYAQQLARQSGRQVLDISFPIRVKPGEAILPRIRGGPAEFVGYVQNAACVLTNSFHGLVFSLQFEKPFLVFQHNTGNTRLADLLGKLGLTGRMVSGDSSPAPGSVWQPINWAAVGQRLEEERRRSGEFLRKNVLR